MSDAFTDLSERGCPVHDGAIHGGEAEQLRAGIERIISDDDLTSGQVRRALQELIDSVNARDSLAYLERTDTERDHLSSVRAFLSNEPSMQRMWAKEIALLTRLIGDAP